VATHEAGLVAHRRDAEQQAPGQHQPELGLRVGDPKVFVGLERFDGSTATPTVATLLELRDQTEQALNPSAQAAADRVIGEQPFADPCGLREVAAVGGDLSRLDELRRPPREDPDTRLDSCAVVVRFLLGSHWSPWASPSLSDVAAGALLGRLELLAI
jgi:hypothetical protein